MGRIKHQIIRLKVVSLLLIYVSNSYGFSRFSGRSEGFCRSYYGVALGYETCGWNPALLAVSPKYSFNIATIGLEYNANLRISDYTRLMKGIYLTEEDKRMFHKGENLDFCGNAQAISFSYKNIGVMSCIYTHQSFRLSKDVIDLLLRGNEIDRTYSLGGVQGKSDIGFSIVVSGAQAFGEKDIFTLGGGIKYIYGIAYEDIYSSSGYLRTTFYEADEPKISGEGKIIRRSAKKGYGLGIDLGVYYTVHNYFMSASITNAFSQIMWNIAPKIIVDSFVLEPVDLETFDPKESLKWGRATYKKSFSTSFEPFIDFSGGIKKERFCISGGTGLGYPHILSIGSEISYKSIFLRGGSSIERRRVWIGLGIGWVKKSFHLDIGIRWSSLSRFSGSISASIIPLPKSITKRL